MQAVIAEWEHSAGTNLAAAATDAGLSQLASVKDVNAICKRIDGLQRELLVAHPLVYDVPILYVVRHQYPSDHHNTATLFQTGEINTGKFRPGGALKILRLGQAPGSRVLVDPGSEGAVRDPEVHFDGDRVVFSMRRRAAEDYHIYEVNADGSGLRALTSLAGVADIDPLYVPDGGIVFTSTREPKYCMCNRHIMANLYRMEADGANIHQIGKSTLFEGHSALMPDGRILYDRWEYVDRNFGDAQGLWTVNPDGSNHAVYWGNNTASPGAVIDARIIPGTTLCLCIFSSCHDRPRGAVALLDRSRGVDGAQSVVRTWPPEAAKQVDTKGVGRWDAFVRFKERYEDPYPLDEKFFLVAGAISNGDETGIFMLDVFGNRVLLHQEEPGCFDPMPLAPRPRPAARPVVRDFKSPTGTFYVQDVYQGTHMAGVKRGEIKFLRIVESPEKRSWSKANWGGQGAQAPGMNWLNFENKRILGTVPVEADGSAHFEVPAEKFVFFQALDANGMMVQSMRSGTMVQPAETLGCVGCHEDRTQDTPPMRSMPLALKRQPSPVDGWHGPARLFSFQREVQPVFDRRCVSCHDYGKPAGKKLLLAGDRNVSFSASYVDLWSQGYLTCAGAGPAEILQAKSWGSHASKLIRALREGRPEHKDVQLEPEELERIITWVDINAPYYPYYECAYPANPCGRSPLSQAKLNQLSKLTGAKFVTSHGRARAAVSFDRPERSPCLTGLDPASPEYAEALAMIKEGQRNLQQTPRADMEGFVPCPQDLARLAKYDRLREAEARFRDAIARGEKRYDRDFAADDGE